MSTINTNRASYQRHPNLRIGKPSASGQRALTVVESNKLRNIIRNINEALASQTDTTANYKLSQAYRELQAVLKERI